MRPLTRDEVNYESDLADTELPSRWLASDWLEPAWAETRIEVDAKARAGKTVEEIAQELVDEARGDAWIALDDMERTVKILLDEARQAVADEIEELVEEVQVVGEDGEELVDYAACWMAITDDVNGAARRRGTPQWEGDQRARAERLVQLAPPTLIELAERGDWL